MGLSLRGQTSGAIDINAPNAAGNNTITLPGTNGAANQFYKNSGTAGTLTHSSMIETSAGLVGIGTDNPSTKLHLLATDSYLTMQSSSASGNAGILFKDSGGTQNGVIFYDFDDDYLKFSTNTDSEALRITSAGQLLINHDQDVAPDGYASKLQLADDSYQGSSTVWKRASGSTAGSNPALILQKVRGSDINGQGAVVDSDSIGQIRLYGADGTNAIECANISARVDNTVSTNNVPGKLVFSTAKLLGGQGSAVMPTQAMTIKASHNVEIHDGNLIFETAGTGIDFSATANAAGMTNELLDDYEEGFWTPTINSGSAPGSILTVTRGRYTKVGRKVTICCELVFEGGDTGNFRLQSLPFNLDTTGTTSGQTGSGMSAVGSVMFNNLNITTVTSITAYLWSNLIYFYFTAGTDGASWTEVNGAQVGGNTNGGNLIFTVTYFTA